MAETDLHFNNILVINFGQMGDVILSLPALKAIRDKFPDSKITLMTGKPSADVARVSRVSDAQILVDRVELRDGNKFTSIAKIVRLIQVIRSRKFDLVIDLHSLSETNLLGFISGARYRLYSNRENRSLDRLGRFPTLPPKEDKAKHHTDRYFDALKPLGIERTDDDFRIEVSDEERLEIQRRFQDLGLVDKKVIGFAVGAGHPSRCWDLDKFAELAGKILVDQNSAVVLFLGPEERTIAERVRSVFPDGVVVVDDLSILQLMASMSLLDAIVSNDSGPAHIAGVVGTPLVLVMDKRAPLTFLPLSKNIVIANRGELSEITADEVYTELSKLEIGSRS